jgi:hypothetical protein
MIRALVLTESDDLALLLRDGLSCLNEFQTWHLRFAKAATTALTQVHFDVVIFEGECPEDLFELIAFGTHSLPVIMMLDPGPVPLGARRDNCFVVERFELPKVRQILQTLFPSTAPVHSNVPQTR